MIAPKTFFPHISTFSPISRLPPDLVNVRWLNNRNPAEEAYSLPTTGFLTKNKNLIIPTWNTYLLLKRKTTMDPIPSLVETN